MSASPSPRIILWLGGGVLATLATALVKELTENLAVALVVGVTSAVVAGISIDPVRAMLRSRVDRGRESVRVRPTLESADQRACQAAAQADEPRQTGHRHNGGHYGPVQQ